MIANHPLRAVLGAGLAALALTVPACGGDDDAGTADTTAGGVAATAAADTTVAPDTTAAADDTAVTATTDAGSGTAGSGTTGEPADRDAYVEAGMATMGTMVGEAGECVVGAVVDGFGVDTLNEAGLTPETLWGPGTPLADVGLTTESPEVGAVADGIAGCDGLMESFAASAGETVTDDQLSCMEDGDAADLVGELLALNLIGADTSELEEQGEALGDECGLGS